MKGLAVLLLLVASALAVLAYRQGQTIDLLQKQLRTTTPQPSASPQRAAASLDLQDKCAEQARKAFAQSGYTIKDPASYENHYNSSLNRCFIDMRNTSSEGGTVWTYRHVFDAFESKEYGTYIWHTEDGKKYTEVGPFQCEVVLQTGEKSLCHSEDEFSKLVSVYMSGD